MSDTDERIPAELIQRLHEAARIERAEAIRSLWRALIRRAPKAQACPTPTAQAAVQGR